MGRLFGTDGVRGVANQDLTPELAFKLGRAGAHVLTDGHSKPRILIGKDTRVSGDMLEAALSAGITSVGADVLLLGVVPTPAVAFLTKFLQVDAGVMISASHNPVEDNGIKFFNKTGFKLTDTTEDAIEALLETELPRAIGKDVGIIQQDFSAISNYKRHLVSGFSHDLSGVHIALDCANGAAYELAPEILQELGAKVTVINNHPTGTNINVDCGSTHPEVVASLVKQTGADIGITHDGDADRVLAVDENGNLVDGDQILTICGLEMLAKGELNNKSIAATVYSNGGLREAFSRAGADVILTAAGDRYVLEAMCQNNLTLGGEQSGHIIFLEHNTTGDGILTALQLLNVMVSTQKPLSELAQQMPVYPQLLENVRVVSKEGWDDNDTIKKAIDDAKKLLAPHGRIFVRASGTEPVIRVMGEHPEKSLVEKGVNLVCQAIVAEQGD